MANRSDGLLLGVARRAADRAGRALLRLSRPPSAVAPAAPGFSPSAPDHARLNDTLKTKLRSFPSLLGRTTYGAGPSRTRYSVYPGQGIEPEQIWRLQVQRNLGWPDLWCQLTEDMIERDGHLGGIIDTRRQSVTDKPWRLHPAYRGDALSDVLAKAIERIVDKIEDFDQVQENLLSASAYGYALAEIVWSPMRLRIPTLDGNGRTQTATILVPRVIDWVHPKHVRFDRDTDEPYIWYQDGDAEMAPCKFIFHAAVGTGLIERRGFMSSCNWLSAAKRWSERDWLVYGKIFGIPQILGQYPNGTEEYEQHRETYEQMLQDWGEGIPALLPDDIQVSISREAAGRSTDVHGAIIGWANSEMSKRVLGSTLTVEIGNQGAYAAADTHRDAPYMRTRADAKKLCSTLRRHLFGPIIELNLYTLSAIFGMKPRALLERVPKMSFRIEREMSPVDRQVVYEGAVNQLGLEVDENQYRDEMGLDAPRPGMPALRGAPITVGTGGLAPSLDASQDGVPPPPKGARLTTREKLALRRGRMTA